jgi:plasmid stabilization system protein ParE
VAKITWTNEAQRWLEDIFEYIAADNPVAAEGTIQGIYERAKCSLNTRKWATDTFTHREMSESFCTGIFASPIS